MKTSDGGQSDGRQGGGLRVIVAEDYDRLSRIAANLIIRRVKAMPDAMLCAATGASPQGTYERLAAYRKTHPKFFSRLRVVKLDEWLGLDMDDPATCERYLRERLLRPLGVAPGRYITLRSDAADGQAECRRVAGLVRRRGPIDLCLLGIGANGHIGLNEPAGALNPFAHVAHLAAATRRHTMLRASRRAVAQGLTLGMADLLASRRIILLASGASKREPLRRLFSGQVSTDCPASFLRLHADVTCICDRQAAP